jgi:hypothetical protein
MGSDMYMMERDFRPRPNRAEWDAHGNELTIYRDSLDGWGVFWTGPVTEDNLSIILKLVKEIPPKPVYLSKIDKVINILRDKGPISAAEAEYVAHQIDKIYEG